MSPVTRYYGYDIDGDVHHGHTVISRATAARQSSQTQAEYGLVVVTIVIVNTVGCRRYYAGGIVYVVSVNARCYTPPSPVKRTG